MATVTPPPLVSHEALEVFTQQLVEQFAPGKVILFGSHARGEGRWDSDADLLGVMPFHGRHLTQIREIRHGLARLAKRRRKRLARPMAIAFAHGVQLATGDGADFAGVGLELTSASLLP